MKQPPNTALREQLEEILPCVTCGLNADPADGFGRCNCGNKEIIDQILKIIQDNQEHELELARLRGYEKAVIDMQANHQEEKTL